MSHLALSHLEPANRIKQLCSQGNTIVVDVKIPLRRYFRSGQEMVRMANVYADEGSLENAFILYMKFMTLFIEKIRTHPEYATHSSADKTASNKRVKEILPVAEKLKSQLREKYQREYNITLQEHLKAEEEDKQRQQQQQQAEERRRRKLLQDSQRRREEEEEEEAEERRIQELQELSLHSNRRRYGGEGEEEAPPPPYDALGSVSYPIAELASPSAPPPPRYSPTLPSVSPYVPSRDLKPVSPGVPQVDRSSKPVSLLGARSGGLREVRVPAQLMPNFMSLAHSNTARNVETCGVLAGHMAQSKLLITHLLVPKQCGTADSCTTQQEEELFDHQDKLDLITIGWIHTHPTQTAFLSSVDLHTHTHKTDPPKRKERNNLT
ncbi:STAM-binding protein-like isoform X3 [Eriocheir sinensis]|uniref:STAM-binding protein-like isoform X2 n=1 Tax=Eriocheir sinensis TaxID=95602 RepID=UPI0021C7A811|nr:STAM-binding protein-like isoform X2 [Eriocheir sinensis]XP_050694008.1 STAM-binding protein-like isoform X3 [Eriocheir sinensis]